MHASEPLLRQANSISNQDRHNSSTAQPGSPDTKVTTKAHATIHLIIICREKEGGLNNLRGSDSIELAGGRSK